MANVLLLIIGLLGACWFARILHAPRRLLPPLVTAFCLVGTYAVRTSVFDVFVLVAGGVLGFCPQKVWGLRPAGSRGHKGP
ncbi:MAG: tripartite tricarboxylate transporter permease [Planctomycetota bacterium]